MTPAQRDYELERVVVALFGDERPNGTEGLVTKVDRIDSRLDRWDGAITIVKAAAGFVGLSGLIVLLKALGA